MKYIVVGIGTEVGKTIVAAILTSLFKADYWKPVQSGDLLTSDCETVKNLVDLKNSSIFPPVYSLRAPLSPHHAAKLENVTIDLKKIIPPKTTKPLVIEGFGGVLSPLTFTDTCLDLFKKWEAKWIVVSHNHLGSINETLLTLQALKQEKIDILGLIFNGPKIEETESAILTISKIPFLARLKQEQIINPSTIKKYESLWKHLIDLFENPIQ